MSNIAYFDVMGFIEDVLDKRFNLVQVRVSSNAEMGSAEGYTCPHGTFVEFREDVYYGACDGIGRHRFTAAHELGHLFLHAGMPLARIQDSTQHPAYKLSEPQANQFAAELLMPRKMISSTSTVESLANAHGVSKESAQLRLKFMKGKGLI